MSDHDNIISVHPFRRTARARERTIQAWLDESLEGLTITTPQGHGYFQVPVNRSQTEIVSVPTWARGVKVTRAGRFSHAVVATRERGH